LSKVMLRRCIINVHACVRQEMCKICI